MHEKVQVKELMRTKVPRENAKVNTKMEQVLLLPFGLLIALLKNIVDDTAIGFVPVFNDLTNIKSSQSNIKSSQLFVNSAKCDGECVKNRKPNIQSTRLLYDGDNQMYIIDAKSYGNVGRYMNVRVSV